MSPSSALARVPGVAWVILFVALFLGAALWGAYHRGERTAVRRVALHAVNDSVKRATAVVDTATHRTDEAIGRAASAGRRRTELRERITLVDSTTVQIGDSLVTAPLPLVQLVHADDAKLAADSIAIAAFLAERTARQARDTLVDHREALETAASDGPHALPIVLGAGGGAALGVAVGGPVGAALGAIVGATLGLFIR